MVREAAVLWTVSDPDPLFLACGVTRAAETAPTRWGGALQQNYMQTHAPFNSRKWIVTVMYAIQYPRD